MIEYSKFLIANFVYVLISLVKKEVLLLSSNPGTPYCLTLVEERTLGNDNSKILYQTVIAVHQH